MTAKLSGVDIFFIPRHSRGHKISPTKINFRANIDAMKQKGVTDIISVSAVGSLKENLSPGTFVIVNQFICTAFSQNLERTFESRSGNFPILISNLDLPEMEKVPLVRVSPQGFPRLPDWRSSRFLPEDPSWLDRGGKFFKEGMTAYYTERSHEALKHFRQVLELSLIHI